MRLVERFSTVIFALAILAAGAWGQSTVTLEIPDVQGTPGTDVWINVNIIIPEGTEILSGQFTLTYDPGVLSCKEVKPGAFLMGYSPPPTGFGYRGDAGAESNVTPYIVSNVERNEAKNEVGRVNIAFAGAEPISSGSGELIKVRFGVRMSSQEGSQTSSGVSEQQSGCELNIEQPLFNEDITPEVTPGTFTPTGSPGKYIPVKVIDKDTSGVIAGATVELRDTDGEVVSSAVTGDDGMCQLAGAASGETYLVRAYKIPESSGYFPNVIGDITLETGLVEIPLKKVPDVTPTDKSVDFYGNATFDDKPLLPGDVILAKDPDDIICGYFFVKNEGQYGVLHVYGDDTTTPNVDEGAVSGDTIKFFLNEEQYPATETGTWTSDGDVHQLNLNFLSVQQVVLHLVQGWNLISFNVMPRDTAIENILDPIQGKYVIVRGFKQGAKTYSPSLPPGVSDLHTMEPPFGYWIKTTEAVDLPISGTPIPANTPITLDAGWNLIGYLPNEEKNVQEALSTIMDKLIIARGFDQGAKTYSPQLPPGVSDLKSMKPGFGYWIKVTESTLLNYMGEGGGQAPSAPILAHSDFTPTYTWVDLYGEIYIDGKPASPGTKVEAFVKGVKCGEAIVSTPGFYGVLHVYGDDPWTPNLEGALPGSEISLFVDGIPVDAHPIWSKDGDIISLNLFVRRKPEKTALLQNFPNPFNPETWIPFQLSQDAEVKIKIYDLTGRLVRKIELGHMNAGYYTTRQSAAHWDGRNDLGEKVASGTYIYQLQAGSKTFTRKMTILK